MQRGNRRDLRQGASFQAFYSVRFDVPLVK